MKQKVLPFQYSQLPRKEGKEGQGKEENWDGNKEKKEAGGEHAVLHVVDSSFVLYCVRFR